MRRKGGTGLVGNELRVLAASLRLTLEGAREVCGYQLLTRLAGWEDPPAMTRGTLYRSLHAMAGRGLYCAVSRASSEGPARVCYVLTPAGVDAARRAVVQLAAGEHPPAWLDLRDALPPAVPPHR